MAPALPQVQETGFHLRSSWHRTPFSYQLPSAICSQLFLVKLKILSSKGLTASMYFLLCFTSSPQPWAFHSNTEHQLHFSEPFREAFQTQSSRTKLTTKLP